MDSEKIWKEIDDHWADIFEAFKERLPVTEHKDFDINGNVIETERPMIESIICHKTSRSAIFFIYLAILAGNNPSISKKMEDGKRVIYLSCNTAVPMGTGGKKEVHRVST